MKRRDRVMRKYLVMSCMNYWSMCFMIILVTLGMPASARPSQNAAAEDWIGNDDGNPFLSNLDSNKLRFVRESDLAQEWPSVSPTGVPESDQAFPTDEPESDQAFPDQESDQAFPDQESDQAFPEQGSNQAFPDQESDQAFPDQQSNQAFPDQESDQAFPSTSQPVDDLPSDPTVPQSGQPESSYNDVVYNINLTPLPYETTQDVMDTDASDDQDAAKDEETISEALSKLSGTENSGIHMSDSGSCLIALIFQAIKVPEDTLEKLEEQNPDLHDSENDIWQKLLDMMALDFITVSDDGDEDNDEDEEDYYEENYYEGNYEDYYYGCEEGTECDEDTAPAADEFHVMSFPPVMT